MTVNESASFQSRTPKRRRNAGTAAKRSLGRLKRPSFIRASGTFSLTAGCGASAAPTKTSRGATKSRSKATNALVFLVDLGYGAILKLFDDARIGERRRVPEHPAFGDVAKEPAHDLAAARLRKLGRERQMFGPREPAELVRNVLA